MFGRKSIVVGLVVVMLAVFGGQAMGQSGSLGDVVEKEGLGWLAGRWTATTDEGQEMSLVYRWSLDKHVIIHNGKMGDVDYFGIIFLSPKEGKVVWVSADNKGGASVGNWDVEDGKAVLKLKYTNPEGETQEMAVTYEKVNRNAMKVQLCGVEDGVVADEAWATLDFKRQKRQPRAKDAKAGGAGTKAKK